MNTVQLLGRFARDPEVKEAGEHLIARYTIAVQRSEKQADFITCQSFDNIAEIIEKYCHKGDLVAVCGSMRVENWEDEKGDRHWMTFVNVSRVDFCQSSKKEDKDEDKNEEVKEPKKKYRRKLK